ncbi:MAG: hypothetical protein WC413_00910 [Candidatus Nanoarchaeia archaeon]
MPSVTVNVSSEKELNVIKRILPNLREMIAKELSCKDRTLRKDEVSIRVFMPLTQLPIADVEVTIVAYSYPERVKKQDDICLAVKKFISSQNSIFKSVFVWLQLSELGHSIEE